MYSGNADERAKQRGEQAIIKPGSETDSISNSNSLGDQYMTVDENIPSWSSTGTKIPTTFNVMPEQSRKLSYSLVRMLKRIDDKETNSWLVSYEG